MKKRKFMLRTGFWAVTLIALILVQPGCKKEGGESGTAQAETVAIDDPDPAQPRYGGRLVIGLAQEPDSLMEFIKGMDAVAFVSNMIFSKFVQFDHHLNLVPDIITEVPTLENGGISADYLTYTYHLRRDIVGSGERSP